MNAQDFTGRYATHATWQSRWIYRRGWYSTLPANLTATLSSARAAAEAVVVGNIIFFAGGGSGSGVQTVERFDPAAGTCAAFGSLAHARYGFAGFAAADAAYFVGGNSAQSSTTIERLDPSTGVSAVVGAPIQQRQYCSAAAANGYGFLIGGFGNGTNVMTNVIERFNPATNQFEDFARLVSVRNGCRAAAVGKYVYISGGTATTTTNTTPQTSIERLDTETGECVVVGQMASARNFHNAVCLNGKVYCCGGYNQGGMSIEAFDPVTCRSILLPFGFSANSWDMAGAAVAGNIYLAGGSRTGATNVITSFRPRDESSPARLLYFDPDATRWALSEWEDDLPLFPGHPDAWNERASRVFALGPVGATALPPATGWVGAADGLPAGVTVEAEALPELTGARVLAFGTGAFSKFGEYTRQAAVNQGKAWYLHSSGTGLICWNGTYWIADPTSANPAMAYPMSGFTNSSTTDPNEKLYGAPPAVGWTFSGMPGGTPPSLTIEVIG